MEKERFFEQFTLEILYWKMPQSSSHTNGYSNGHGKYDMEDGQNFLFTSESVGEGHPGELFI